VKKFLEIHPNILYFKVMSEKHVPPDAVRLDRWLMAARFFKTRSQAAAACEGGRVKVGGLASKPHKLVRVGDELTIRQKDRYRNVKVAGLAQRGLPASEARKLYEEEIKEGLPDEVREQMKLFAASFRKNQRKFKGRPTKKERRDMERNPFTRAEDDD
jgi:ribosome-associated heat shock protein Hsp15